MTMRIFACVSLLAWAVPGRAAEPAAKPSPPSPPAAAATPAAEEPDTSPAALGAGQINNPPPASPEDVALWRQGIEVSDRIILERLNSNKMQWHCIKGQYAARLEAAAAKEGDPGAARAVELLGRFRPILAFNLETLARRWPVDPTRGCRYQVMHFESVLHAPESRRRATQVLVTREELEDCLDKARPALKVLVASNADLKAAIADVDAFLPPIVPVKAPPRTAKPASGPAAPAPAKN